MVEQVGRYKIERELGRGGMGVVYLAEDPMLGRKVAIKTVHFEITDAAQREYLRTQLISDARASAGLSHPNVVNIHDILEMGDTTYLVMEYISGETLLSRMQRPPAPDTAWLLRVLRDIAGALDYTHRKSVVHRDIKPANIMIDHHARVRIMDFGLARNAHQLTASPTGMVAGTIQYMSPEQIRGDALDGRADQFSLGAVAYELLTGKPLFDAPTPTTLAYKIVHESPEAAHLQNPALPPAASPVLAKALDRNPANRFPTCTAFVEALIATFDGETVQALLVPPDEQPTVAMTGLIDTSAATEGKLSTGPVSPVPGRGPGRLSPYAPWLIAGGLIAASIGVTAISVLNGHKHGAVPERQSLVPYGPPPLIGRGDGSMRGPGNDLRRPPRPFRKFAAPKDLPKNSNFQAGQADLDARNFGLAIQHFTAAIQADPNSAHAYYYRGMAYAREGKGKEAQEDFRKAVELLPSYAEGWYELGMAEERQHKRKDAMEDLSRAAALKPIAGAFFTTGRILEQQGLPEKALAQFDRAIEADPNFAQAYKARGDLKRRMGDPGANDDLQKAKDLFDLKDKEAK